MQQKQKNKTKDRINAKKIDNKNKSNYSSVRFQDYLKSIQVDDIGN
jgi:hypothetical protein